MIKKKRNSWIILGLIITMSCCNEEEPQYFYIPQVLKEWACFKPGSYWVYQRDDSVSITDSMYVSSLTFKRDSVYLDNKLARIEEGYIIHIDALSGNYVKISILSQHVGILDYYKKFDSEKNYFLFSANNNQLIDGPPQSRFINKYDTFHVNEKLFKEVIEIKSIDQSYDYPNDTTDIYWLSKHNWIIKKRYNEENWSLVKSCIVQ